MEAFSLLKYWRGGGGGGGALAPSSHTTPSPTSHTTNAAVAQNENPTESDDEDEGPFFDLEFTVPDEVDDSEEAHENPNANNSSEESEGEREFKFTLSPSSNDRNSLSPSEDLFFKGKLVQVEPSEPNSKPQLSASLLKSATKFRVFMLGLKKPKSDSAAANPESQEKQQQQQQQAERIKFKVEEVPIMSLLTRDNSSKVNKSQSQNTEDSPSCLEDKQRLSKEVVMHKYLKMVKPLYIRVSRKYGDKLNSSSGGKAAAPATAAEGEAVTETGGTNVKSQKQGNLPAGLRVVCKHLGKSRSASSAVAAAPPAFMSSKRRDDSLLQQQDGIQGAILHCKRSFNASRESESSQLPRSVSDSLHEISSQLSRKSINEGKDKLSFA